MSADIGALRLRCTPVGGAAFQDEAFVAIAAVDEALLVDLQTDARVAKRGLNVGRSVAGDAGGGNVPDLGRARVVCHATPFPMAGWADIPFDQRSLLRPASSHAAMRAMVARSWSAAATLLSHYSAYTSPWAPVV